MEAATVVGSWRLVRWRAVSEDDAGTVAVTYPMGEDADGLIHYSADGRMSVLIAAAGREPFASGDLLGGSVEERAAAFSGFLAYAGGYTMGDGFVTHRLEISSFPNWVGSEQLRYVARDGDQLFLSTDAILTSGTWRRSELTWTRIPGPA